MNDPNAVRTQLARVLGSQTFLNAPSLRRFLEHLVEQVLAGNADHLKEYTLGLAVFDRKESFDPRTDTIVRVQARRLRAKLAEYYKTEGQGDPVVIQLPKGHYAASFKGLADVAATEPVAAPQRHVLLIAGITLALAVSAAAVWRARHGNPPESIHSIAVLPLANLSGNVEEDYFAEGMTEALITELARIRSLRVISRQSVLRYKNSTKSLLEIAHELNVDSIVEGSVTRAAGRVRTSVQLIHAASDRHLWAGSHERAAGDVLALQAELARALAGEIRATITTAESSQLERSRVVVPEAYDLYSRGRYFFNRRMIETDIRATLLKAIAYLEQATQKDETFAPAYAGLAEAHSLLGYFGYVPPQKAREALQENAEKALALDDTLAEAHNAMAVYRVFEQDWDGAEREYLRAIDLNPNYPVARAWYGFLLIHLGRSEQALEQTRRGLESDPFNTFLLENDTLALLHLGRYDEALAQIQESVELEPRASVFEDFYFTLGSFYRAERRDAEAIDAFEKAGTRQAKAMALNARGDQAALRALLKEARQQSMEGYVSPIQLAEILTALGDNEAAFSRLEEAYVAREPDLLGLKESPVWEPLRSDPRFADLLRRLELD